MKKASFRFASLSAVCTLTVAAALILGACTRAQPPLPEEDLCQPETTAGASVQGVLPRPESSAQQVIVAFKNTISAQALPSALHIGSTTLILQRTLSGGNTRLYELGTGASLNQVLASLRARPDVLYAELNERVYALATPNDPNFSGQWDLKSINLPAAWDVTTGSPSSTIAVLDTGILYDQKNPALRHPDLASKVLPGYDFIADTLTSQDGDGRDANPYDPGNDGCSGGSSYHGTHVAGIAAAATNNGVGVSGVNWNARILPVRVLGRGGGVVSDVADGLRWAAGMRVLGVPLNTFKASVVNLSVGGGGEKDSACPVTLQNAINDVVARGVVVVAAAGNSGMDAAKTFPADCQNVVAVGATTYSGSRASYSNFGATVDVMAPGGPVYNLGADDTHRNDPNTFYTYVSETGTSMAAPHVAGVVALIQGLHPDWTVDQVVQQLKRTARPLSDSECGTVDGNDCGAGLIDAAAAVQTP